MPLRGLRAASCHTAIVSATEATLASTATVPLATNARSDQAREAGSAAPALDLLLEPPLRWFEGEAPLEGEPRSTLT